MNNIFSYIKNNVDILSVIGDYVNLMPAGNYYKGFSPFKHEKTASFTVTPEKNIFYCFSSHIGGDVVEFVARMENCSQYQAAQFIIQKYNLVIPKEMFYGQNSNQQDQEIAYFKVYNAFTEWCHQMLYFNKQALEYLYQRGLTDQMITQFKIGFCPDFHMLDNFFQFAMKKNILVKDIKETDIVLLKNNKLYFSAYNRIIFPIKNHMHLTCGYGARTFLLGDNRPKYINTNNNVYFSKKNTMYSFDLAKEYIKKNNEVYIVEGYIDAIMMHQAGFLNTIATMGTACTKYHLQQLAKFTHQINLVYDGDIAGQEATKKIIEMCWAMSLDVSIIRLPSNSDPAELVQQNKISDVLICKENGVDFFVQAKDITVKKDSLHALNQSLSEIIHIVKNIEDPTKQSACILQIAHHLNLSENIIFHMIHGDKQKASQNISMAKPVDMQDEHRQKNYKKETKVAWYVLFYFILLYKERCRADKDSIIFLYQQYGIVELGKIITQYYEQEDADPFSFLQIINQDLYQYGLKIYSTYVFLETQLSIFYKKIITLSWQIAKQKNQSMTFVEFYAMIKK